MGKITKCENCGAELVFSPERNCLVCKSCGSSFMVKNASGKIARRVYSFNYNPEDNRVDETQYECPSCGSKIMAGREKPLGICASCGNTNLIKKTNSVVVPDGIIPFTISKAKAGEIFQKFVKSRKFAPSDLAQMARSQKLIGVYNPVWKFDFETHIHYSYVGEKKYLDKNDNEYVKYYPEDKTKEERFENVLLSGNKQISDKMLEEIGDYDFSKAIPYSSDYVLGFYLIDTNRDLHVVYDGFKDNIEYQNRKEIENRVRKDYDSLSNFVCHTRFKDEEFGYVGVPIWANHYTYKGKNYHCYINGQTGKFSGSAPKSIWKILGLVGCGVLALGALLLLLFKLF